VHGDARFLEDFARDGVLEAFARFHEPRDRRITACGPGRLSSEQRALAVGHQHDHGRVEPRKVLGTARRVAALHNVPGALARGGRTACAAMTVPAAPQHHRTRISEQASLVLRQCGTGEPQILEGSLRRQSKRRFVGELRCKDRATMKMTEQDVLGRRHRAAERIVELEQRRAEARRNPANQAPRLPDGTSSVVGSMSAASRKPGSLRRCAARSR
jgi:hypothetical protein